MGWVGFRYGGLAARQRCVVTALSMWRRYNEKTGEYSWTDPIYNTQWREIKDESECQ